MRMIALSLAVLVGLGSSAVLAQQKTEPADTGSPPPLPGPPPSAPSAGVSISGAAPAFGSPLLPGASSGLDKLAEDGVSTRNVPAVPCTVASRETDGTTTCVGIPRRR